MRRPVHRSPLQSFRFWFVLLSVFAMAAAWKLDLFGNRRSRQSTPVTEETLPEPDDEAVTMLSDVSGERPKTQLTSPDDLRHVPPRGEIDLPLARQSIQQYHQQAVQGGGIALPPAPLPPRELPRGAKSATALAATNAPKQAAPRNPFGPANPEFVAMPDEEVAQTARPRSQQEPADRRTALLEQTPPDLTSPRPMPSGRTKNDFADNQIVRASNSETGRMAAIEQANAAAAFGSKEPPVAKPAFALPAGSKVDLAAVDRLIQSGDDVEAHRLMSEWYWKEPASRPAFQERLDQLARRIYLQPQPHYMDPHIVASGEMLSTIAKEYSVPWQYLAKLNRTDAKRIKPGQKLKVIKGPFSAVVDLSDFELTIHAHGYYVKRYQVGVGRDNSSPYGSFKVQDKLTDPTYYGPNGVVEHDDPDNPLGEYWISIGDSFGIHGTIDPNSIGKAESEGCIRMRNEDVAEVYEMLSIGSDVVIRP